MELDNAQECRTLEIENPIRKVSLYKSTQSPMVYEVGRIYGRGKFEITSIEFANDKYYVFVNKILPNKEIDSISFLWKAESSPETSVEYFLDFMDL